MEWSASCETRSIDGGAQGGFGIGGPFGAITVGDFSLDDAGSERALADIIGGIDPAREIAKGEYLVARAADLAEQFARQLAIGGAGEDGIEVAHQRAPSVFHRGGGERGDVAGKPEGAIEPELDPHPDQIAAILGGEACLAIEMSKARLVTPAMPLLGRIAIRYPYFGFMSGHRVVHNLGGAAELGGMDDGLARTEHPLIRIASLDPHARLVAGDDFGAAQGRQGIVASGGKDRRGAFEHVHQRALAELQAE